MEKDDMNAKSLSTILHLKSLTEQAEKEKVAREQEAKSAEQVALAARLAENAKDRVTEEALKEKKVSRYRYFDGDAVFLRLFASLPSARVYTSTNNSSWREGWKSWRKSANA
jgi:hypothetical protein